MAILLTLGSNLAGIFTVPFTLPFVVGRATSGRVSLSSLTLLIQMVQTILLPTVLGYMVRESSKGNKFHRCTNQSTFVTSNVKGQGMAFCVNHHVICKLKGHELKQKFLVNRCRKMDQKPQAAITLAKLTGPHEHPLDADKFGSARGNLA